jgi:hypothetical protein
MTAQIYLEATLAMKELSPRQHRLVAEQPVITPTIQLLGFLNSL